MLCGEPPFFHFGTASPVTRVVCRALKRYIDPNIDLESNRKTGLGIGKRCAPRLGI